MENYRIGILGMGGVGGYLGAKLAALKSPGIEVIFIARNETKTILKQNGLKLITDDGEQIVYAQLVSDDPKEIGHLDLLICAVKGYDLNESLERYLPCLGEDSVVLPLLNGINIAEKIKKIVPEATVWEACIYIIARQVERGVIKRTGAMDQVFIGSAENTDPRLKHVEALLINAGVMAEISPDIGAEMWKKFFFISVMATFTSYYDSSIGLAQKDKEKAEEVQSLLKELEDVAIAEGVKLPDGLIENVMNRIASLAPDMTSSMYADFKKGGKTELEALTGEVVRLGKKHKIETSLYAKMYLALLGKNNKK